ncbi:MAG TPA: EAL domain-containing protein [Rhodanobacteraceae bacterium]
MVDSVGATGILLVASQRDDRRCLFDLLDKQGFRRIHAARDATQARVLLAERPALGLVLLEFAADASDALAFCAHVHGLEAYRQIPILGLATAATRRGNESLEDVRGWLHLPADGEQLREQLELLQQTKPAPAKPAVDLPQAGPDDYRFAFDDDDRCWVISTPDGQVLDVNAAFARHVGATAAELRGRTLSVVIGEAGVGPTELLQRLAEAGVAERMVQCPRADGGNAPMRAVTRLATWRNQVVHVTALQAQGHVAQARGLLNLLAQLRKAGSNEAGVRQAAQVLVQGLALDFVGVYAAMPEANAEPVMWAHQLRQPLASNDAVPDVLQQPALHLVLDGETLMHSDDAMRLAHSDAFVAGMNFKAFAGLPLVDERGSVLGALLAGSREPWVSGSLIPETLHVAAGHFAHDMELRRARAQGRAHGLLDGLTRLPNRLLFNDRLENTLREARRTGEMFAVLFVDLDRFKSINDSLGHSVGDEVLTAVARRLRGSVRASDTVARYAGDEFTVILRHITQREDVLRIADKMVRLMDAPLMLADGSELHITASIGVSFYPDDAATAERLLKHADVAMYSAKGKGRNGYQVYVAQSEESHQQRVALESKLRQAERNGELRVYYQPQVDVLTEDIVGMEALVRWEHPELGMISPGFFIPLAEETGLIVSIGEWVLRRACESTARWTRRYGLPLRIGVNLSALQLMQPRLPDMVMSALHDSGLPAGQLELEVTESISVKSIPHLLRNLARLHDMGCHLAIDDFGTGQASLDYLRNLPADRIKIDQSFVRNIGVDPDDEAIVKATIDMAHGLNRAVIAEGVETEAHLSFLRQQHCEELQGYLFCRPLPRNAFDLLLAERQRLLGAARDQGTG